MTSIVVTDRMTQGVLHLPTQPAVELLSQLADRFFGPGDETIDGYTLLPGHAVATAPFFAEGGGKMFGLMAARDAAGRRILARAFSGQFAGQWLLDGWAPPPFDVAAWQALNMRHEPTIAHLTQRLAAPDLQPADRRLLVLERRARSRDLMRAFHQLYRLHNFRGEQSDLGQAYCGPAAPATGVGECCAPKLLNWAARLGWQPLALCEFYWGKTNRSGTRHHRQVYLPCADKCQPILGYLLSGWTFPG